jgi:thiol-disulfide isomerase/thioredoxin
MGRLHSAVGPSAALSFSAWLLTACLSASLAHAEAFKLRVVDDQGQGVQRFQVYVQNERRNAWIPGVEGFTVLEVNPQPASSIKSVSLAVRADGYASACSQHRGEELEKLLDGKAVVTLSKGAQVELNLQLFEGVTLPIAFPPDVDFDSWASYVQTIRPLVSVTRALSPLVVSRAAANRAESGPATFKMHPSDSGNYSFRLAPNTERIWVGIHCPGVLQYFDAGPFTFADVKDGVLTVDVPKPAALDVRTDLGLDDSGLRKIRSYSLSVQMLTPGGQRRLVASEYSPTPLKAVHLAGLAAATYTISFRTTPNVPETGSAADDAPNPGRYNFEQEVKLQPGKTETVEIRYVPHDPNAFHGNRTAVIRFEGVGGQPAPGREVKIGFVDPHFGSLPVFSGPVPESGEITLTNLTDSRPTGNSRDPYDVTVNKLRVGRFGFSSSETAEHFVFRCPPQAGDVAPDLELKNLADGKSVKLSDFRGKCVLLDFWATWCGPCQPALEKLDGELAKHADEWKEKLVVLPVGIDDESATAKPHFASRGGHHLETYWTGEGGKAGWKAPAVSAFAVAAIPHTLLIDPDGKIVWQGHPMIAEDGKDLETRIRTALKEPAE